MCVEFLLKVNKGLLELFAHSLVSSHEQYSSDELPLTIMILFHISNNFVLLSLDHQKLKASNTYIYMYVYAYIYTT